MHGMVRVRSCCSTTCYEWLNFHTRCPQLGIYVLLHFPAPTFLAKSRGVRTPIPVPRSVLT